MSATAEGDGDSAYFRAIEDAFVRLRGAPLLLSPADFQVASRWRREGVPLQLVMVTLEEVFAHRRERGTKGRINSLRYCAPAVEQAWAEVRALQGPARRRVDQDAGAEELDVPARVAALAAALRANLPAALPTDDPRRESLPARVEAVGTLPAEEADQRLWELDDELLAAAEEGLEEGERATLAAEVEGIVAGLRERFPAEELQRLRAQLRRQRLRRLRGLPVLTLF